MCVLVEHGLPGVRPVESLKRTGRDEDFCDRVPFQAMGFESDAVGRRRCAPARRAVAEEMSATPAIRNRTIWILWSQGFDNAPDIVKLCLASWRRFNPGWEVRALDGTALNELVDLDSLIDVKRDDITIQVLSDLGRLSLLRRFGGVWTDATVFCCKPLDDWLSPYVEGGFFAFRNPGPDRLMANWFIAANPENAILANLHRKFVSLWTLNRFVSRTNGFGKFARRQLSSILNKSPQRSTYWFSFFPMRVLRVYPYYIFHYTFNGLILGNEACGTAWEKSPHFEAAGPRRLTELAKTTGGLTIALEHINQAASPVYKLNWRLDINQPYWKAVHTQLWSKLDS
jgi:hypothetical protein